MVVITRRKGETKESMFRKFTRTFIDEDIVTEFRKKLFYKKPSLRKKDDAKERLLRKAKLRRGAQYRRRYLK